MPFGINFRGKSTPEPSIDGSNTTFSNSKYNKYKFNKNNTIEEVSTNHDEDQLALTETDNGILSNQNGIPLLPSDKEKTNLLTYFHEMRKESSFCDIAFVCQNVVIRAHKVVVSSWSRWLRSILLEGSYEDIITLDIFNPQALGSIIDYMYGVPLMFSLENADNILKVIRRLELQGLEQQCWKYLITIIDTDNCSELHNLSDKYDCPPLKLAAFRVLQESNPMYASPIRQITDDLSDEMKFTNGFTGPGEANFYETSGTFADLLNRDEDDDEYDDNNESELIDDDLVENKPSYENFVHAEKDEDDENYENNRNNIKDNLNKSINILPKDLPNSASANDVVKSWSEHLGKIYQNFGYSEENDNESTNNYNVSSYEQKANLKQSKSNSKIDWKHELKRFYLSIKMPEKITSIDSILEKWQGKEDQMISSLLIKYKKQISPTLYNHFNELHDILENMTESSFIPQRNIKLDDSIDRRKRR